MKKTSRENLLEFFLIFLGGALAAIGGALILSQCWFSGILSFLSFIIINFMLSKRKQNKILYGTSIIPGPASNFPEGTIYLRHKK